MTEIKLFQMDLKGYSTIKGAWRAEVKLPAASEAEARSIIIDYYFNNNLSLRTDFEILSIKEIQPERIST